MGLQCVSHWGTVDGNRPSCSILVVDDDPMMAEWYARLLEEDHDVTVATGGQAALETIDPTTEIMLLDRTMPDVSGEEVIDEVRERNIDCLIAIVSGRSPDVDDADLAFDAYLVKPVDPSGLQAVVDELIERRRYTERVRELFALDAKIDVLETAVGKAPFQSSDRYDELVARRNHLADDIWSELEAFLDTQIGTDGASDGTSDDDQSPLQPPDHGRTKSPDTDGHSDDNR